MSSHAVRTTPFARTHPFIFICFLQILKQVLARLGQARIQMSQMNFGGAITRFDFALRKLDDVLVSAQSQWASNPSLPSALALLTTQAIQVLDCPHTRSFECVL